MSFSNWRRLEVHNGTFSDVAGDQYNFDITNVSGHGAEKLYEACAHSAAYDSADLFDHPTFNCSPGTRKDVLATIAEWILKPNGRPICWLNGMAGAGKTVLAHAISESCDVQGVLAASFFFYRGQMERTCSRRLFPTIANQLSISIPDLKSPIHLAVDKDPSIPGKTVYDQLEKLIIEPLFSLYHPLTLRRVIVIDALDECDNSELARDIITHVTTALDEYHLPFQFIITSRPENYIRNKFREPCTQAKTRIIDLCNFDARNDIRTFLVDRFQQIYQKHYDIMCDVQLPWPAPHVIERIVNESSGLFIFASTIIRYIDNPHEHPDQKLSMLLSGRYDPNSSPHAGLDRLYTQILSMTPYSNRIRCVLGSVILVIKPLSVNDLGHLLSLQVGDVRLAIRGLYSVLVIPDSEERHRPVKAFHKSLHDYLTDFRRSDAYFIDPAAHHSELALGLMTRELKRDMCKIGDPSKFNNEVTCLAQKCDAHISGAMQYACCCWARHLARATCSDHLIEELRSFVFKSILYWIETLSLLQDFEVASQVLERVKKWLQEQPSPPVDLIELLGDARWFVNKFRCPIRASALQVYHSALPFMPQQKFLRRVYQHEFSLPIVQILNGFDEKWAPYTSLPDFSLSRRFHSIALSSTRVIGNVGDLIQSWDSKTGNRLPTLSFPYAKMFLDISRDGTRVAWLCHDSLVEVWDVGNGGGTHLTSIGSELLFWCQATFSPDGKYIAIATCITAKGVNVWDVETGHQYQTLTASDKIDFYCGIIIFSHRGTRIAHLNGRDHKFWVWDTHTGDLLAVNTVPHVHHLCDFRHAIFSPDDGLVAFASRDPGTLVLLDAHSGQYLMHFDFCGIPLTFYAGPCILSTRQAYYLPTDLFSSSTLLAIQFGHQHYYHLHQDGWIFDGVKRVCWLPSYYRPSPGPNSIRHPTVEPQIPNEHGLILATQQGDIMIVDFSKLS